MLEVIDLESWEEFENQVKLTINERFEEKVNSNINGWEYNPVLFRGQPDAAWKLQTTLERHIGKKQSLYFYQSLISSILPEIETFTGKKFDIRSSEEENKDLAVTYDLPIEVVNLLPLEYMAYLRHYGFPSPLLDWSVSPFIAAYFAFRDTSSKAKRVAIYEYHQVGNIHRYTESKKLKRPIITSLDYFGPNKNNKRHYLQQSVYTICVNTDTNQPYFDSHENLKPITEKGQNKYKKFEYLKKYTLPVSLRDNALLHLGIYNVNSYSLMGTEESLLETLFAKHLINSRGRELFFEKINS